MLPVNYHSSQRSFQGYLKPVRHYASHKMPEWITHLFGATKIVSTVRELTFPSTIAFRAAKTLSTVGDDIPVEGSFQSYQNLGNFKNLRFCSF